jgi:hypothetical protein
MVNGPGTVIFTARSVAARRNSTSVTCTGDGRRISPTTRGAGMSMPERLRTLPGWSRSSPSSAVAKWLE